MNLDFQCLLVFVGRGLLRRSEQSRGCASLFFGIFAFSLSVFLIFTVVFLFYPKPVGFSNDLGAFATAFLAALFGYAWKSLKSKEVDAWFEEQPVDSEAVQVKPFQFRLSTLLYCTFLVALICVLYRGEYNFHPLEIRSPITNGKFGWECIATGIRKHRRDESLSVLEFVVFETETKRNRFSSSIYKTSNSATHDPTVVLETPDGTTIELPNYKQLYEIHDGEFRASDERVTLGQLEAYLEQLDGLPNLKDLIATPEPKE